jgi:hypothetical protein
MGPLPRSFAADAHGCIMVQFLYEPTEYKFVARCSRPASSTLSQTMNGSEHKTEGRVWAAAPPAKGSISSRPGGPSKDRQGLSLGLAFVGSSSMSVR